MGEDTCKGLSSQSYSKDTLHQTDLPTAILTSNSRKKIKIQKIIKLENKSESQKILWKLGSSILKKDHYIILLTFQF